jgi:hypothetical protein
MARETWTDERLDDLNKRVDDGFKEMRDEFRALRAQMIQLFGGMFAVMLIGFLSVVATILVKG